MPSSVPCRHLVPTSLRQSESGPRMQRQPLHTSSHNHWSHTVLTHKSVMGKSRACHNDHRTGAKGHWQSLMLSVLSSVLALHSMASMLGHIPTILSACNGF